MSTTTTTTTTTAGDGRPPEVAADPIANPGLPGPRLAADRRRPEAPRSAPSARSPRCSACRRSAPSLFVRRLLRLRHRRGPRHLPRPRRLHRRARPHPRPAPCCCIGIGVIQWARKLMADHEIVEMRHPAALLRRGPRRRPSRRSTHGLEESGIGRRPLVRNSLLGAIGAARPAGRRAAARPRPARQVRQRLGRLEHTSGRRACASSATSPAPRSAPATSRSATWSTPSPRRSSRPTRRASTLIEGVELQVAKAKAAVILVRMEPDDITPGPGRENWSVDGILCYSKICTHVGCPISLYERTTHHLLCPCHQSTFDLADNGKVDLRPGRPRPAPAAARRSTTRGTRGAERLHRTGRTELLGA